MGPGVMGIYFLWFDSMVLNIILFHIYVFYLQAFSAPLLSYSVNSLYSVNNLLCPTHNSISTPVTIKVFLIPIYKTSIINKYIVYVYYLRLCILFTLYKYIVFIYTNRILYKYYKYFRMA